MVDAGRLIVYGAGFFTSHSFVLDGDLLYLTIFASTAAFIGSFIGKKMIKKITYSTIQIIVGILLLITGTGLLSGFL